MRLALAIVSLAFVLVTLAAASFVSQDGAGRPAPERNLAGVPDLSFGGREISSHPEPGSTLRLENALVVSGQVGREGDRWGEGARQQAELAFANLERALEDAGATIDDVVELTSYHTSLDELAAFRDVMGTFLSSERVAWSPVEVSRLEAPESCLELRAVAVLSPR